MSDTPRTDDQECDMFVGVSTFTPSDIQQAFDFARTLERELNAANDRIKSLIEERDRANRLAEWKWNLRDEFQLLLGTDKIEEGIEAVKELKRRIKRLENIIFRASTSFFEDGSDRVVAVAMLMILDEAKEAKP